MIDPPWFNRELCPRRIIPLVDQHGADRVREAGIKVLGYPPFWEPTSSDIQTLSTILKGEQ